MLLPTMSIGQNLIPNPGFELTENCGNTTTDDFESSQFWYSANTATPDLYCTFPCATQLTQQVLLDSGLPMPFDGNCYAGLLIVNSGDSSRDYIQAQLLSPLEEGETYHFSVWISIQPMSGLMANKMGVYLSEGPHTINTIQVMDVEPQWEYTGEPLSPINTWVQLQGDIVAQGGEAYFTLGCFRYNDEIDYTNIPNIETSSTSAYYVFDNLRLEKTLGVANAMLPEFMEIKQQRDAIYITNHSLYQKVAYSFYSIDGRLLNLVGFIHGTTALPIDSISNGIYIIKLSGENFSYTKKIVLNH